MRRKSSLDIAFWLLWILASPLFAVSDDDVDVALQNPFLRERFRDREQRFTTRPFHRRLADPSPPPWEEERADFMLERRIDQMIRVFAKSLIEKRDALKEALTALENTAANRDAGEWAKVLKELADRSGDLRSILASVISDLPEKTDYKPVVEADSWSRGFAAETEFMRGQTELAFQGIDRFFFHPGGTVTVSELKGDDMMQHLHRVELMAKKLLESLPAR